MLKQLPLFLALLFSAFGATLTAQDPGTVVDEIAASEDHTILEELIGVAGLTETLNGDGPFTVFAPTDDAFNALGEDALAYFRSEDGMDSLVAVLQYHVVGGNNAAASLENNTTLTTLNNEDMLYVTVMGEMVMVNNAMVTMADLPASNGVIHVIDAVLMPPAGDIGMVIMENDTLTTLTTAIEAAGLGSALSMEGGYTVFAPSDAAFDALPEGDLEALLDDPEGDLTTALTYHVVAGTYYSGDLEDGMTLTTMQGEDLEVTMRNDSIFVDGVAISGPNMIADNGVVHVIDGVLLPGALTSTRAEPAFAKEVSIAPNPATSFFTVNLPMTITNSAVLTLRDLSGRVVATQRATSDRQRLDVGNLANGTYLLEVRADAGTIQRKVMVQR